MKNLFEHLEGRDIWWGIITLIILFAVIGFAAYSLVTGRDLKTVEVVLVQLFGFLTLLLSFRYGSSKGSKDKDKMNNPDNGADTGTAA